MKKRSAVILVLMLLVFLITINFAVAALTIAAPEFGVAQDKTFDITITTTSVHTCRYSSPFEKPFDQMTIFDITGSTEHEITGFPLPAFNTQYDFFVNCGNGAETAQLKLKADNTNPSIISATANPVEIVQFPLETTLTVETTEETFCKYDDTADNYDDMQNVFTGSETNVNDYKNLHQLLLTELTDDTDYSYNTMCKDLSGRETSLTTITFKVNTSAEPRIINFTPKHNSYTSDANVVISIATNKNSVCKYGNETPPEEQNGNFNVEGTKHEVAAQLDERQHTYYFKCIFEGPKELSTQTTFTIDNSKPLMLFVDDDQDLEDAPKEYTYYTDRLKVEWEAEDNESGIKQYNYSLRENGGSTILDWVTTSSTDVNIKELNLENGKTYVIKVKAENNAGLWSDVKESSGVTVDISLNVKQACRNKVKDGVETDVDCGGICPNKCTIKENCKANADCKSGYCGNDAECAVGSCNDGIKNQDETDADCGGLCMSCLLGDSCKVNADCQSNICVEETCLAPGPCENKELDAQETDVDCGGICADLKNIKCIVGQKCAVDSDCTTNACGVKGSCVIIGDRDEDRIKDEADNCALIYNPTQIDTDKDGEGDECDEDDDNDSMTDVWELKHGFNPLNAGDALLDSDGDTLNNLREFQLETNPKNADSDGDGFDDATEVAKGTNPNSEKSKPGTGLLSKFLSGLLILLVFLVIIGYFYYRKMTAPARETKKDLERRKTSGQMQNETVEPPARKYRPPENYTPVPPPARRHSESYDELQQHHASLSGEEVFDRLRRHTGKKRK